jgi:hypothetical protein
LLVWKHGQLGRVDPAYFHFVIIHKNSPWRIFRQREFCPFKDTVCNFPPRGFFPAWWLRVYPLQISPHRDPENWTPKAYRASAASGFIKPLPTSTFALQNPAGMAKNNAPRLLRAIDYWPPQTWFHVIQCFKCDRDKIQAPKPVSMIIK